MTKWNPLCYTLGVLLVFGGMFVGMEYPLSESAAEMVIGTATVCVTLPSVLVLVEELRRENRDVTRIGARAGVILGILLAVGKHFLG